MCGVRAAYGSVMTMNPTGYVASSVTKSATIVIGPKWSTLVTCSVRRRLFRRVYANRSGRTSTASVVDMSCRKRVGVSETTAATLIFSRKYLQQARCSAAHSSAAVRDLFIIFKCSGEGHIYTRCKVLHATHCRCAATFAIAPMTNE